MSPRLGQEERDAAQDRTDRGIPQMSKYLEFQIIGRARYIATHFIIMQPNGLGYLWWTNSLN